MSKTMVHRCDFCPGEMGKDESKHHTVSIDGGEPRDCCQRCFEWLFMTKHRMRAGKKGKRAKKDRAIPPNMGRPQSSEPIAPTIETVTAAMEHAKGVMRAKGERGDGTFAVEKVTP